MVLALIVGNLNQAKAAIIQSVGLRDLLLAEKGLPGEELSNPFMCLRDGADIELAKEAELKVYDDYLKGAALCLAGERSTGLEWLKRADGHSNAEVQFAAGLSVDDPQAGTDVLSKMDLSADGLLLVVQNLNNQPEVEIYPALRLMAKQDNDRLETWILWMQTTRQLELADEWKAAYDWLIEGLKIAPQDVRGSLYIGAGWILQTQPAFKDYQTALDFYNRAIDHGGWVYPEDEVNAHMFRGDLYRILADEFGPELAIEEYNAALNLQPGNASIFVRIGSVYLFDLKEMEQAETFFLKTIAANDQNLDAYLYIGDIYQARGDIERAAGWYHQALEREPNYQDALDRLKALEGK